MTDYIDFTYIDMPAAERLILDVGDIYLNVGKCKLCGWVIRSKNRHDMVYCKCRDCFIDGGSWYIRCSGHLDLYTVSFTDPHLVEGEGK